MFYYNHSILANGGIDLEDLTHLTIPETAEILRMHPNHLRRIARQGKIEFVKLGRKYGFTEQHIKDYIERSSTK